MSIAIIFFVAVVSVAVECSQGRFNKSVSTCSLGSHEHELKLYPDQIVYRCDSFLSSDLYDARVVGSQYNSAGFATEWSVSNRNGAVVFTTREMPDAIQHALDNVLNPERISQESILVIGDGIFDPTTSAINARVRPRNNTLLNICGTIHVLEEPSEQWDRLRDFYAIGVRGVEHVTIPNIRITGTPQYGIMVRSSSDIYLGNVEISMQHPSGEAYAVNLGIRMDSRMPSSDPVSRFGYAKNYRLDNACVQGATGHAVESFYVQNLTIGNVYAYNMGQSGLQLNGSIDVQVDKVWGKDLGKVTPGYGVLRMANSNGRKVVNGQSTFPTNIKVKKVFAQGGQSRAIFCVSGSGGAKIDHFTVDGHTSNESPILIQNCYNVALGSPDDECKSSITNTPGSIRIGVDRNSEHPNSRDIRLTNIITDGKTGGILEEPCTDNRSAEYVDLYFSERLNVCSR